MKKLLFLLSFLVLFFAAAQETPLPDPEGYFSAVIVEDFDSSLNWYTDVLGFELVNQQASEARGFQVANLQRGGVMLEILELKTALSPKNAIPDFNSKTRLTGIFKTGFFVANFDGWVNHFKAKGVTFRGNVVTDPESGKKMVIVQDPDGNRIQFFEK